MLLKTTNPRNGSCRLSLAAICAIFACAQASSLLASPASLGANQSADAAKKLKNRDLRWSPPALDAPVPRLASSPPCSLATVLEQTGARATEMVTNLQNFSAQEEIRYQTSDRLNVVQDFGSGTFDYVVVLRPPAEGSIVEEYRKPTHGSDLNASTTADMGLPAMALLFLPELQPDYEMACEGSAEWESRRAWVVRFQQRRDKPSRTFSFHVDRAVYAAALKGRAWIASDSGEILHMETGLMDYLPAVKIRHWFLSIDYAPVQFQSRPVSIWLPQIVDGYSDFGDRHTIVYHTFTNFLLFSIATEEKVGKPKAP